MTTAIRRADLDLDRERIIECLAEWLTPTSDARRFDWLYRDNPAGEARVWISADADETIVGVGAAFPRRLWLNGTELAGWVLGDFCVNPAYRSLGPALALQRACLSVVETDEPAFCYDFPNPGMMAVYRRLRRASGGEMVRLARPLRVDRKVREIIDVPGVTKALSAAGNVVLGLRDAVGAVSDGGASIGPHEGRCGEEFDALALEVSAGLGLCVMRSSEYVEWRYLSSPHRRHELITARRGGELVGWAAFYCEGQDASLVDLFGRDDRSALGGLVNGLVKVLRKRGIVTLSAPIWASHRWLPLMRELGFSARETSPVVVCASSGVPEALRGGGDLDWFLWQGDRDS